MGGGFGVICVCYKDSTTLTYGLGDKVSPPYDSASKPVPYYADSCSKLKTIHNSDSSKVAILFL